MLDTRNIPGFSGGVSQLPMELRRDTEVSDMTNCVTSLSLGTQRRPGTSEVATLTFAGTPSTAYIDQIDLGSSKWALVISDDTTEPLQVYNVTTGAKATITVIVDSLGNTPLTYVKAGTGFPSAKHRITTVDDTTYILNNTVTVAKDNVSAVIGPCKALMQVTRVVVGGEYALDLRITDSTHTDVKVNVVPTIGTASDTTDTIAASIAKAIYDAFVALGGTYPDYVVYSIGPYVRMDLTPAHPGSPKAIDIKVYDNMEGAGFRVAAPTSIGGINFVAIVPSIEVIPYTDPIGTSVRWRSTGSDTYTLTSGSGIILHIKAALEDGYYLVHDTTWIECAKPGLENSMWAYNFPVRLMKTSGGFDLRFYYESTIPVLPPRLAGDDTTNPYPSFIGKTITDIGYYKERMTFLSADTMFMGVPFEPAKFFAPTVTDVLDSDPIDISASSLSNKRITLDSMVVFEDTILINSTGTQQFQLVQGGQVLSPKTCTLESGTSFSLSTSCRPLRLGINAYFMEPLGSSNHLREFYVTPDSQVKDALRLTQHVPEYLLGSVTKLVGNSPSKMVLIKTNDLDTLFVHQFDTQINNGASERIQNSFHKWTFDRDILGLCLFDASLYLITLVGSAMHLESMDLTNATLEAVHMDHTSAITGSYNAGTGITTFTPSIAPGLTSLLIDTTTGKALDYTVTGVTMQMVGDYSGASRYTTGTSFTSNVTLSQPVAKDRNGLPALDKVMQLASLDVAFRNTGYFRMLCTPLGTKRQSVLKDFWWMHLNTDSMDLVSLKNSSDIPFPWRMPTPGDARGMVIQIYSNGSHLPFQFDSYTHMYSTHTR